MVSDSQNPARPAVVREAVSTEITGAAADIDLPHHPLAQPGRLFRSGHHPDELVARDAAKIVVAFEDLQVGAADTGQGHADQDLAGSGFGLGEFSQFRDAVDVKGKHFVLRVIV